MTVCGGIEWMDNEQKKKTNKINFLFPSDQVQWSLFRTINKNKKFL